MKWFLVFSIFYLGVAIVLSSAVLPENKDPLITLFVTGKRLLPKVMQVIMVVGLGFAVIGAVTRKMSIVTTLNLLVKGVIAGVAFQTGFTLIKASLPYIIPFYADGALAHWDAALHFGADPWVLTHALADYVPAAWIPTFYFKIWGPPAGFLPIVLCLMDPDPARVKRTMILFVLAWVLVGNFLALGGMSVGPIYYDRVYGAERFADLAVAMNTTGLSGTGVGWVQEMLWSFHNGSFDFVGPGISAFPSVHVAVATVLAIYLAERSRVLGVIGTAYMLIILFLSVYTGFHYAVDGYVSIVVMLGLWAWLKRREAAGARDADAGWETGGNAIPEMMRPSRQAAEGVLASRVACQKP